MEDPCQFSSHNGSFSSLHAKSVEIRATEKNEKKTGLKPEHVRKKLRSVYNVEFRKTRLPALFCAPLRGKSGAA